MIVCSILAEERKSISNPSSVLGVGCKTPLKGVGVAQVAPQLRPVKGRFAAPEPVLPVFPAFHGAINHDCDEDGSDGCVLFG